MLLSDLAAYVSAGHALHFRLPDGSCVPAHFHVTELGVSSRRFIDCGGTVRETRAASLQLWTSVDVDHRLEGDKLARIIDVARERIGVTDDLEVEVEYQGPDTIARYGLAAANDQDELRLVGLRTDCLALESCGVPDATHGLPLATVAQDHTATACTPGGGCC